MFKELFNFLLSLADTSRPIALVIVRGLLKRGDISAGLCNVCADIAVYMQVNAVSVQVFAACLQGIARFILLRSAIGADFSVSPPETGLHLVKIILNLVYMVLLLGKVILISAWREWPTPFQAASG